MSSIIKSPEELRAMGSSNQPVTSFEPARYKRNSHRAHNGKGVGWFIIVAVVTLGMFFAFYNTNRFSRPSGYRDATLQEVEAASRRFDAAFKTLPPADLLNYEPATESCVLQVANKKSVSCPPDSIRANLYLNRQNAHPLTTADEIQKLFTTAGWLQKEYYILYEGNGYKRTEREAPETKTTNKPIKSITLVFKRLIGDDPPVCAGFSFEPSQSRWSGSLEDCRAG